jgi:hypothetical protein
MAQTSNLKLISPDASSVLIPLHSHFAVLASGVDQAITDRFQYKILAYETVADRDAVYTESTGLPVDVNSSKPALVDGDICYIRQNKRYYIWNVNTTGTNSWIQTLKRFTFSSIANRDAHLAEDTTEGDTCYVTDVDIDFVWDGSAWLYLATTAAPRSVPATTWYQPAVFGTAQGAQTSGRIYYIPFHVPVKGTYDAYNAMVVTAGTSSTITYALFNSSITTGLPTTIISNTTATAATVTTGQSVITTMPTAQVLQPGWYWIGVFCLGSVQAVLMTTTIGAAGGGNWWMPRVTGTYSGTNAATPELIDNTNTGSTAGTMPNPAGSITTATTSGTRAPFISLRKSA